jgi:hypothetical protein
MTWIRPNKLAVSSWAIGSQLVTDRSGYWLLWAAPILLLGGHLGWQWRQQRRQESAGVRRSNKAAKNARRSLRKLDGRDKDIFEATGHILTVYLSTRLNRSIAGLTQLQLFDLLLDRGIDPSLVESVQHFLSLNDLRRYAPGKSGLDRQDIVKDAGRLINDLDKAFSRRQ